MPDRPAKVAGSAPSAVPRRVISARPRVMRVERVLMPSPMPSAAPIATAMTFFVAPAISVPTTSVDT